MEQFATEEQQVEAIKRFWKENGTSIIIGAVIGLGALWGWRYYTELAITEKEAASVAYQSMVDSVDSEEGLTLATSFADDNINNAYGQLAAFVATQKAVTAGNLAEAETLLTSVISNASTDAIKNVAIVRLARVQIEQAKYDSALSQLNTIKDDAFLSQVNELKGDVFSAQQKYSDARTAYAASVEEAPNNINVKMKLDNLTQLANNNAGEQSE